MPIVIDLKPVKTVIAIDSTGSMSMAIRQVCDNIKKCVVWAFDVMKEKNVKAGFEIQIVTYKNYDAGKDLLFTYSPSSNNATALINFLSTVQASHGICNEAVEIALQHVLYQ